MKKTLLSVIFLLAVLFIPAFFASAEDGVVETPDVKIIIDGKITTYNDVPLSVKQRTMLPLRELLVNLGVPNDDEHIVWNNEEKSVTIYKDSTKIYLKQGSRTAYVNDKRVILDVSVIGYSKNQRTYIPARFVSECLGMRVVWDGSTKAVLIRNAEEFDKVKEILEKSNAAMESSNKYKFDLKLNSIVSGGSFNTKMNVSYTGEMDESKKNMHMLMDLNMLGMEFKMDSYLYDSVFYVKNPLTEEWQKKTLSSFEIDQLFNKNSSKGILDANDILSAGLFIAETEDPDEILLKWDVYLSELYKLAQNASGDTAIIEDDTSVEELEKFYLEISINKNTNLVNWINMSMKGTTNYNFVELSTDTSFNMSISDYNGDFEVTVPQDVLENAVEVEDESESPAI